MPLSGKWRRTRLRPVPPLIFPAMANAIGFPKAIETRVTCLGKILLLRRTQARKFFSEAVSRNHKIERDIACVSAAI